MHCIFGSTQLLNTVRKKTSDCFINSKPNMFQTMWWTLKDASQLNGIKRNYKVMLYFCIINSLKSIQLRFIDFLTEFYLYVTSGYRGGLTPFFMVPLNKLIEAYFSTTTLNFNLKKSCFNHFLIFRQRASVKVLL